MPSASERPQDNREAEQQSAPATGRELEPLPQFDWLTEVAIPVCVFGLLGSLLYYLIEVRSALASFFAIGPLRWVVFWFLLACIGIARIRTKYGGAAVAGYYSALLAGAIALFVFVYTMRAGGFHAVGEQSRNMALLLNWAMVALVWWAASAVTREATLEENFEAQLEGGFWTLIADEWQHPEGRGRKTQEPSKDAGARPRHPGRLVLWVSLVALVLFAVGQRAIGDVGGHARIAFLCMASYLLFALLLLALTNLSALRMQVRQRGISLAPTLTPAWIISSAIVVAAIVVFSFVLAPRFGTDAREQIAQIPDWISRAEQPALDEGPTEGIGPDEGVAGDDGQGEATHEREADEAASDDEEAADAEEGEEGSEGYLRRSDNGEEPGAGEGEGAQDEQTDRQRAEPQAAQTRPDPPDASRLLLWILLIAAALAILFFLWVHRGSLAVALRHFASYLARLPAQIARVVAGALRRLAGLLSGHGGGPAERGRPPLPEDPLVDIFARGIADDLEPAEIIRYVYRAFQAYAARAGHERREDQTALEFLRSLPSRLSLPDQGAERLTRAYVLATYSPREITQAQVQGAWNTWTTMKDRVDEIERKSSRRAKR